MYDTSAIKSVGHRMSYCHWFVKSGFSNLSANHTEFSWNGNVSSKVEWKISRNIPLCILVLLALYNWWPTLHGMFSVGQLHVLTFRNRRSACFLIKIMKSVVAQGLNWETFLNPQGQDSVELEEIYSYFRRVACFYSIRGTLNRNYFVPWKICPLREF